MNGVHVSSSLSLLSNLRINPKDPETLQRISSLLIVVTDKNVFYRPKIRGRTCNLYPLKVIINTGYTQFTGKKPNIKR